MALNKLPLEVQSIFQASAQIRTFKTAVEELVYNALDANSSSIAIRVHIQEHYIQVVDNGHGVASDDFNMLGQRHTTSKFETPRSNSIQKYGRYGQSLANLIEVSQSVKIISKCMKNAETWMKQFCNGKDYKCSVTTERPSGGTTVEVKGFLYNLTIQKKSVKVLEELQSIKTLLEQISLVHCNISISLRDNSENEIIFKTHKNRSIIQTLASVLSIETCNLQELQVEKNQYKVTGFIQKNYDEAKGYQWIYVNERLIANSNLHNIMSANLGKDVFLKNKINTESHYPEDEKLTTNKKIPDYFIFINCPQHDYDIIPNPKQSIVEFKNVSQINNLLEKLVKFHIGDIHLANATTAKKQPIKTSENRKVNETRTRNKVKQIIQKIMGTQQKKMSGSNLHNGVKGNNIRRKVKKKAVPTLKNKLKLMKDKKNKVQRETQGSAGSAKVQNQNPSKNNRSFRVPESKQIDNILAKVNQQQTLLENEKHQHVIKYNPKNICEKTKKNTILLKFEKETVQKRCNILANKVDHLLGIYKKRKCNVCTNETVHYSKIIRDNKSSKRNKVNVIKKIKIANGDNNISNDIKTSNDLIHPVINIVHENILPRDAMHPAIVQHQSDPGTLIDSTELSDSKIPGPTFESHCYLKEAEYTQPKYDLDKQYKKGQFISRISRDNFVSSRKQRNITAGNLISKQKVARKEYHDKRKNEVLTDVVKSSYSLHFTATDTRVSETREPALNSCDVILSSDKLYIGNTYTVAGAVNSNNNPNAICILETPYNHGENVDAPAKLYREQSPCIQKTQDETERTYDRFDNNVVFISNSQYSNIETNEIEPLEICETVIGCNDKQDYGEYTFIFDSINNVFERETPNDVIQRNAIGTVSNNNDRNGEEDDYLNNQLRKMFNDSNPDANNFGTHNFNMKNRRRYIPKGMSPIFENCNLKNICNYEFDEDYFGETVYDNFVQNVQMYSEIFEPKIQNVKDTASRDVQKIDNNLNKDNTCFTFNGESLKHSQVLGQVDNKFIATILKGTSSDAPNCLVLFDQHAVHERIRLEQNMSEYISDAEWKSVSLDGVSLKLTRDEILYLHNYKDKFQKLGLQWCMASDTQVLINAIPVAILGKHPRQVDVVLKAVKSLIKEEINIIKEQGGCVSLYPKSIMDLVFSEACRYAIMFGDALSARECASLVEALSRCRTPFRCAHGRPAMAVLVDIPQETRPYTVNFSRVDQLRRKLYKCNK